MPSSLPARPKGVKLGVRKLRGDLTDAARDHDPTLTRRDVVVRGALALAALSPILRRAAQADVARASVERAAWALGAFVNPGNRRLTFAGSQRETSEFESLV